MPKECTFGGHPRARISSQCLKRAAREYFAEANLLSPESRAFRTRRLAIELADRLEKAGKDRDTAEEFVRSVLGGVGLSLDEKNLTQYVLFLGEREIAGLSTLCLERWDDLLEAVGTLNGGGSAGDRKRPASKRDMRNAVPKELRKAALGVFDGGKSADIALFGRMIVDLPDGKSEGAVQVAHAISTNRLAVELDYFTALDDLQPDDVSGAGMLGTAGFNSSCFYRYSNINVRALQEKLRGDEELTLSALESFLRASIMAIPRGSQNGTAAHSPPSFILAVLRESNLWSLVNSFDPPVRPTRDKGIVTLSAEALDRYWGRLATIYGEEGIVAKWAVSLGDETLENLKDSVEASVEELIEGLMNSVRGEL